MQALSAADSKALVNGWGPRILVGVHNTFSQPLGGALAAVVSDKASTGAAMGIGFLISLVDAFAGPAHPYLRIGTQVGPGMMAGATALRTAAWIRLKSQARAGQ